MFNQSELSQEGQVSLMPQTVKNACSVGDLGSISGPGRYPGEGNGYPL